jgi:hypothetical protein
VAVKIVSLVLGGFCVLTSQSAFAQQPASAGLIKLASGSAVIVRNGSELPAEVGMPVLETDRVKTGADGRVGITLKDDTRVSLGPGSEVHVATFRYPSEGAMAVTLRFVRGVVAYVSGRIAKLSPDAVRLETPNAIVGVRGTTLAIRVGPD